MKKYELTENQIIDAFGDTLYQIRALIDIPIYDIRIGDLGGFIGSETNLSQSDGAWVSGDAQVFGNAQVYDNVQVSGDARVFGNAQVFGDAWVFGNAQVYGNAQVSEQIDFFIISNIGSRNDTTTFFKCEDSNIRVSCGCFYGNLSEFKDKIIETHGDNKHAKDYLAAIQFAEIKMTN